MEIMKNKFNHLIKLLNENLKLLLSISFGIFLFILFFQSFPLAVTYSIYGYHFRKVFRDVI